MKSSPTLRMLIAAGMYLLLMCGYVVLQTPQVYAAFAALIMSIALLFWVNEARSIPDLSAHYHPDHLSETGSGSAGSVSMADEEPSLSASLSRLDSLKDELTQQYAQFGKDQSLLNSKGLGTWQQKRGFEGEGEP